MTANCNAPTCATTSAKPESAKMLKPRFAVSTTEEAYVVRVELPGVDKSDVNLNFEGDVLSITATRNTVVPGDWKPLHRELNQAGFALRLKLNTRVDEEKLKAQLEDGVLTLTLPVREAAKPRKIEVN